MILLGTMAPSGDNGISNVEVLGLVITLVGVLLYLTNTKEFIQLRTLDFFIIFVFFFSLLNIFERDTVSVLRGSLAFVIFFLCFWVGERVKIDTISTVVNVMYWYLLISSIGDIMADLYYPSIGTGYIGSNYGRYAGGRGGSSANSIYPILLFCISIGLFIESKTSIISKSIRATTGISISFITSIIIGNSRSGLLCFGVSVLLFLTYVKSRTRVVIICAIIIGCGLLVYFDEGHIIPNNTNYARLTSVTDEYETRSGRVNQVHDALYNFSNSSLTEQLTGLPEDKITNSRGSEYHNFIINIITRYGLQCFMCYLIPVAKILVTSVKQLFCGLCHSYIRVLCVLIIVYFIRISFFPFPNWRNQVLIGVACGITYNYYRITKYNNKCLKLK